ncbi:vitamin B6 photo-protection and homoeostasis-domain-containing protein [Podospora australis]|uniref:diphosphomevalonate decarboxylase n=1 Tax=Podospora australis TaxID=1536484 RepID=A0AAN6WLN1_9PEZI|nr:vitamin B6 photo-protection and homoeostasis-domain-containing protein [Podospora australis]
MASEKVYRASTTAPVNIAVVKYWGKRDAKLNLPTNSSLSVTLSQDDLRTLTTASTSASYPASEGDSLLLNGAPSDISGARTQACLRELRTRRAALEAADPSLPKLSTWPLRIVSENNFPTAAGLASSAAGFAALVRAIANLYELPASPSELSLIARQGSGSACRSLFGGYVAWRMGSEEDGSDSMADQVAMASHWPDMRALVLVVSAAKKGVSSTSGMQQTVATSGLFKERITNVVPQNMAIMEKAIAEKDFEKFAEVTMRDSNSFHATCADTYPPIFYMNDISRAAIRAVETINEKAGRTVAAYTFDAGPNAVIYYLEKDTEAVVGTFYHVLQGNAEIGGWKKAEIQGLKASISLDEGVAAALKGGVSRVIMTGVGEGPVKTEEYLVAEDGSVPFPNSNATPGAAMSKTCYDIDPAGEILCTYTGDGSKEALRATKTIIPPAKALLYAFLPAGYPHTVTTDYLPYQTYDSLQAFASSITSLLASRAVLEGLGVGDSNSSPTGALILKITGDTISRVATILFAHRMGQAIEPECKFYRFLADIFNDSAQFLDLLTPALPYFPKLGVIVSAGVLRSLCGVAANASKASLSAHFAVTGNLAELNAKEASQETVVSLLGMLVGSLVVKLVEDKATVWILMVLLAGAHLATNYKAVRSVRMRTLNRQRATIVFKEWLDNPGTILSPAQVAERESILFKTRGNLSSKTGEYTGFCSFANYGELKTWNKRGYHRYEIETAGYFMGVWHRGGYFYFKIALKETRDKKGQQALEAWFDAVNHAYHFDSFFAQKDHDHHELESQQRLLPLGHVSTEQKENIFAALEKAGWDLDTNALETRLPVRVRVGAAAPLTEKDVFRHREAGLSESKHD